MKCLVKISHAFLFILCVSGHKEEDETPSVSAVLSLEQTAVIQEMVNQDVLPKLMIPSPASEPQMVTED